ncbi:hypothetical protein UFOVP232_42 [uncultured Caudovirales phage]|uniref:Uncharacterized protein n=1 Tax=uncultured Caudovirales phage TaxID=2100421 RepID=A0A6J7WQN5_9CAUD|nr:hypothetical protein UFOVP232_42 [uncultured Caudovirales phage]
MQALSAFYPRILPYLPGCSEPLAAQVLVNSAIEFCENSMVLRQNLDTFTTVAGVSQYDLDPPTAQHDINRVMGVTLAGMELRPGMAEIVHNDLPTDRAKPRAFYTDRTDSVFTLRLTPPPDAAYPVVVAVTLRPKRTASLLDDDLYNIWIDPIVSGAIARAMQIPDQPFTNFPQADYLLRSAAKQTNTSRIESTYGLVRGSMSVRFRSFA